MSTQHAYKDAAVQMIRYVNTQMAKRVQADPDLIGNNPLNVMFDNHENHARFIATVLMLEDRVMLEKTVRWAVDSYRARGFSVDYFPRVLSYWMEAVRIYVSDGTEQKRILAFYELISSIVEQIRQEPSTGEHFIAHEQDSESSELTELLLTGNRLAVQNYLRQKIEAGLSFQDLYTRIVRSSMYEIGELWQSNTITVAHEHLASSIIASAISNLYEWIEPREQKRGSIIVTASANEYHEIGTRMISDILEIEGWEVYTLGANMPIEQVLQFLRDVKPFALCISVTMTFNLSSAIELAEAVRRDPQIGDTLIIVGGLAFLVGESLPHIPADLITSQIPVLIDFLDGEARKG